MRVLPSFLWLSAAALCSFDYPGREVTPQRPRALVYAWQPQTQQALGARFPAPAGCRRVPVAAGSWGEWLRWLPLKPAGTKARLYNGQLKDRQDVVAAVVDIDVPPQDLQQCADAVIRLRAEYVFSHDPNKLHFHLTTGYDFWFSDFVAGRTFRVANEEVLPATRPAEAPTHAALARYLVPTFGYAGTLSLSRELRTVPLAQVQPGDVLIHGGAPGHAVLVVEVAENMVSHQQYVLLAQSYMPAQSIHLLRNVDAPALGAWFAVPGPNEAEFDTPEWTFARQELKRFE
ncbi:DUF4846 domain-containing protein [Hymenobacter siberiensis]|jgi:hypothetical protein|uniref:DUF4846 domain-containing protein n=1 Tax=Hymenobacter siberiensis TaxID=2848396 RepID=UPI001C1E5BAC|nr:DUF4846 domain-containing protein [Hymenobacter siberiensis]MBU6121557.1 DUF4846 domain-containing protein [Hymenobacter siberiensis]